ncbi:MAG TPA: EamA family transporter [Hyphomicrobiaceae bacterium]|nr:EamA family transporter [Hyphomicrobiaceae bacterium]
MDPLVFLAVLSAAVFHAGWNALLKIRAEPRVATTLVAVASAVVAAPLAVYSGIPRAAAWPYLLASATIHVGYFLGLSAAYRVGDLGQVYPIARGTAPLITAVLATYWLGEQLGTRGTTGILVLAAGILLLAVKGGRALQRFNGQAVTFALLTSLTIASYTLVDGIGARRAGDAVAYTTWLFVLAGAAMAIYGRAAIGSKLTEECKAHWPIALGGAALSVAAYVIVVWAMTVAPIALVAALRETSVLFAAVLGTLLLREPLRTVRIAAACLVLAGVLLVRAQ